jgi:hypothetical protein
MCLEKFNVTLPLIKYTKERRLDFLVRGCKNGWYFWNGSYECMYRSKGWWTKEAALV